MSASSATKAPDGGASRSAKFDVELGARIRLRRTSLGMSQTQLARQLGVSFQQVQKYERGSNRVSGARLCRLAEALGASVHALCGEDASSACASSAVLSSAEAADILRAFEQIKKKETRGLALRVIASLVD